MKFVSKPRIRANHNLHVPLAAVVELETDEESRVTLRVSGRRGVRRLESGPDSKTTHQIPVVGLHPGEICSVDVMVNAGGTSLSGPETLIFEVPTLPDDFPLIVMRICDADRREPGAMMFNIRHAPSTAHMAGLGLLVAVDRFGDVIWTYHHDEAIGDVRCLANGNLLFVCEGRICEINWLGEPVNTWYRERGQKQQFLPAEAIPVDAEMFHHAVIELPSGNFLACTIEQRQIEDFPASEDDPAAGTETATVVGDVIVEFRRDGTIVNRYPLLDLLDPHRICYDSRDAYWVRRGYPDTCDWSHLNGLAYRAEDDQIVASVRHQDCLIAIDRPSGELLWILGTHENWRPPWSDKLLTAEDGLQWPYHQHDCSITPSGGLLCFDNGNHRATPFTPKKPDADNFSRVVVFEVDPERRSVREVWARGQEEDGTFSAFQSGATLLPATGNMFINYGGICTIDGVPTADVTNCRCKVRLIEVAPGPSQDIVFEMIVEDEAGDSPRALSSFRTEHVPGLGEPDN